MDNLSPSFANLKLKDSWSLPRLPEELEQKIRDALVPYNLEQERIADMKEQVKNTTVSGYKNRMVAKNSATDCFLVYDREIAFLPFQKQVADTNQSHLSTKGLAGDLNINAPLDSDLGKALLNFLPKDKQQYEHTGYEKRNITRTHVNVMLNLYNPFYFQSSDQNIEEEGFLDWLIYDVNFSAMIVKMSENFPKWDRYVSWPSGNSTSLTYDAIQDMFYAKRTKLSIEYLANLANTNRYSKVPSVQIQ